jgi:hypothetical protein
MVACVILAGPAAHAQKGVGDSIGVVRQGLEPALTSLSGVVQSVQTHPCENTTGRAVAGTHIMLRGDDGHEYNMHLGPADAVSALAERLKPGARIEVAAFRTTRMSENHYVVTTLTHDGESVELRDAGLQPVWSQQRRGFAANRRGTGLTATPDTARRRGAAGQQQFQPQRMRFRGGGGRGQRLGRANRAWCPYWR